MIFILMTILLCGAGFILWRYSVKALNRFFEREENAGKKRPSDRRLQIWMLAATILNIGLMALSFFFYRDKVIYALKLAVVFEWIITIAFIDFHCYEIPNRLIVAGACMAGGFAAVEILLASYPVIITLKDYFFGFLMGAGVFLFSALIAKGSVGAGDIKLYAVLGLLLGWAAVFNLLFCTILVSAICGIVVLLTKKGDKKTLLPLAPFTFVGMAVILLLGV